MASSRFTGALCALLFLALCAYIGAALFPGGTRTKTVVLCSASVTDSAPLRGIVVRREQPVICSAEAASGSRVPAGGVYGAGDDGAPLAAASSVIFMSGCDGFEDLSPAAVAPLSVRGLAGLLEERRSTEANARLVSGFAWYYAALAPDDARLPLHGHCRLLFDGFDEPAEAYIVSASAPENGQRTRLFRLTAGGEAYLSLRQVSAKLITEEYSGLRLPDSAVHKAEDGTFYVETLTSGALRSVGVKVIYTDAGYSLVAPCEAGALREGSRVTAEF